MHITKNDIYSGCLIASLSHAIMTNVYPDFSYEQSWDSMNYSIQDSSGMRGTITFEEDFCVGAIRNEKSDGVVGGSLIQEYIKNFPSDVVRKAREETFQYLLLDYEGRVEPCVSSVFWADDITIHYEKNFFNRIKEDFVLLENILLPKKTAIRKWAEYYDMDSKAICLVDVLYQLKIKDAFSKIRLSEEQCKLIPGGSINDECIESLKELNIIL